ncbi:BAR adaptor protein Hob3 [Dimargaris cristalligena]|nr:BAR adaptor protein Hob3 [Dimargaris cristalligena]
MSWSGFKKSMNRTGISLMQGFGAIDKTVDKDFLEKEASFKHLQVKVEELHKEARGYGEAVKAMTTAQLQVAEHLEHFYDPNSAGGAYSAQYRQTMADIDTHTRPEFDDVYQETVMNPIGRYCGYIPEFNAAISKRGRKLLDYDQARSKAKKLADRQPTHVTGGTSASQSFPDEDRSRAEQAESQARTTYEVLNQQLSDEIPQFVNIRVPYLEPSFEALLKAQLKFFEDSYAQLQTVGTKLPLGAAGTSAPSGAGYTQSRDVGADGAPGNRPMNEQVEDVLQEMRDLSICGMTVR